MLHHLIQIHVQQLGLRLRRLAQPTLELRLGIDAGGHALLIEGVETFLVDQDVTPARFGLELMNVLDQLLIVPPERGAGLEVALDQGRAQEDLARLSRIDRPEVHPTSAEQGEAIEGDGLKGRDLAGARLPVRLGVAALEQMAAGLFDPARLDLGADAPVIARGLDPLGADDPLRRGREQRRAGMDIEAPAARALILALLVLAADGAEQARQ